jgi:hypothetical protein
VIGLRPYIVYALLDPDTLAVRYVGCSRNIVRRHRSHGSASSAMWWHRDLRAQGKYPILRTLEVVWCVADEWREVERRWIGRALAEGADLLNVHHIPGRLAELRRERERRWEEVLQARSANEGWYQPPIPRR